MNPNLPLANVRTVREIYDRSMARTSFTLVMLGIAAAMALLLGLVGIYGVIAYSVTQRTREIGIRMALGATQDRVRGLFVRHGLVLAGIGVLCGIATAIPLTRLMTALLFEVSPLDPLTYVAVAVLLVASALLATYLPARRAALVEPVEALRAAISATACGRTAASAASSSAIRTAESRRAPTTIESTMPTRP